MRAQERRVVVIPGSDQQFGAESLQRGVDHWAQPDVSLGLALIGYVAGQHKHLRRASRCGDHLDRRLNPSARVDMIE
jgi:hypothetical protein